jgi:CheY-like chemotaxis protein
VGPTALVVDDHAGFRAIARSVLEAAGLEVVGEAADGAEAIAFCQSSEPDLVLLDVQLPDIDGFEVRERLLRTVDPPAILLTSVRAASAYASRLNGIERIPYVSKDELSVAAVTAFLAPR